MFGGTVKSTPVWRVSSGKNKALKGSYRSSPLGMLIIYDLFHSTRRVGEHQIEIVSRCDRISFRLRFFIAPNEVASKQFLMFRVLFDVTGWKEDTDRG
ncbi:unnamed protein product [Leptosia nina]|uniref:Uncharacterized protein n=1 Tax=Leptosia nina TaxID=320188 RepID=A0AAV1J628_9NEOP